MDGAVFEEIPAERHENGIDANCCYMVDAVLGIDHAERIVAKLGDSSGGVGTFEGGVVDATEDG